MLIIIDKFLFVIHSLRSWQLVEGKQILHHHLLESFNTIDFNREVLCATEITKAWHLNSNLHILPAFPMKSSSYQTVTVMSAGQ